MKNTQSDELQPSSNNQDRQDSNYEVLKRQEIKDTPFTLVTLNNEGKTEHFAAYGKYRITEHYDKADTCINEVKKVTWNRLVQVMALTLDFLNSNKDETLQKV